MSRDGQDQSGDDDDSLKDWLTAWNVQSAMRTNWFILLLPFPPFDDADPDPVEDDDQFLSRSGLSKLLTELKVIITHSVRSSSVCSWLPAHRAIHPMLTDPELHELAIGGRNRSTKAGSKGINDHATRKLICCCGSSWRWSSSCWYVFQLSLSPSRPDLFGVRMLLFPLASRGYYSPHL